MQPLLSFLRQLLRRLGVVRATIATTLVAVLVSLFSTIIIALLLWGRIGTSPLIISISVSLPVSALFSYVMLRLTAWIDRLHEEVQTLARVDTLTGLANRRSFIEYAQHHWRDSPNRSATHAIIVFDIDNFKGINDGHGHPAGDCVLRYVAERCREHIRRDDIAARYGGEEFALLLPHTTSTQAVVIAERIRQAIEARIIECEGAEVAITASFGICTSSQSDDSFEQALRTADRALYTAKRNGKNRVVLAPSGVSM